MSKRIMFILSDDPREQPERASELLAQALTALSFGYHCDIFLRSSGVSLAEAGYVEGVKAPTFEPVQVMLKNYFEMDGRLYCCHPAADARSVGCHNCHDQVEFVNASKLIENSIEADAVISY